MGIDVSKMTVDTFLHNTKKHKVFSNSVKGFKEMCCWIESEGLALRYVLFCFEQTGMYSMPLASFLSKSHLNYVHENALVIKRSLGLVREKSDKADSKQIARYCWLHREELELTICREEPLEELRRLLSGRDRLVRERAGSKGTLKEYSHVLSSPSTDTTCIVLKQIIGVLTSKIKKLETAIEEIIKSDPKMELNYELVRSVKGLGKVLTSEILIHTRNFTTFKTSRQFASYCGVAPFERSSGTSLRSTSRTHHICDRKLKSLLTMASISAIRSDPELRDYFLRKVEEGKSKMAVINAVRNKLIGRAFAVVRRGTPFVELHQYAA